MQHHTEVRKLSVLVVRLNKEENTSRTVVWCYIVSVFDVCVLPRHYPEEKDPLS